MRDLILFALLPYLIYACFKRPFIGLALWLWSSLVPVNVWSYGTAGSIRWNFMFAACTMLSYFFYRHKKPIHLDRTIWLVIAFFIVATLSTIFHQGFHVHVWNEWEYLLKSTIFFIFVVLIVDKKIHFDALMWACALSISARAAIEGVKVFFSGGGHIVSGITPTFNDNNLSAMATLMCIPMLFYLYTQYKSHIIIKLGLFGLIISNVLMVFGTESRGGMIGLAVLGLYFFLKSKRKMNIAIVIVVMAIVGLNFVDQDWFERMQTIKTANEDGSFMSRVISWKLALLLAIENPILGGGFDAASYAPTWYYLTTQFDKVSFIPSPEPHTIHVAHSIYFQVLSDLGFLGLLIYLLLLYGTFQRFNQFRALTSENTWLEEFGRYMTLVIVSFAVAGAALSAAYNELFIALIACSIIFKQQVSPLLKRPK